MTSIGMHPLATIAVLLVSGAGVSATTFTLTNSCPYEVWPGVLPDAGQPSLASGGFSLAAGQSNVLSPPAGWAGRFWGRTGCSFDANGRGSCTTGDCDGQLQCNGAGGSPPISLAEFSLGSRDFYDVSLVDGYNVPMAVAPVGGSGSNCTVAGCATNLLSNGACPAQLQVVAGGGVGGGRVVACRSACEAFGSPQYCCTGAFANPQDCGPSSYSQVFKRACPTAYSYAYDDPTSTFTCVGAASYTITFCPSGTTA